MGTIYVGAGADKNYFIESIDDWTLYADPHQGWVGDNGSKLYVGDDVLIYEYDMSTPHDLTTLSYSGNTLTLPTSGYSILHEGMAMNPAGTRLYSFSYTFSGFPVVNYASFVTEYALSTAWDLSTASVNYTLQLKSILQGENSKYESINCGSFHLNGDYFACEVYDSVTYAWDVAFIFKLNTAWDLSSYTSYDNKEYSEIESGAGIAFVDGGKYILSADNTTLYALELDTANDISSGRGAEIAFEGTASIQSVCVSDDEKYLYAFGYDSSAWDGIWVKQYPYHKHETIEDQFDLVSGQATANSVATTISVYCDFANADDIFVVWARKDDDAGGDFTFGSIGALGTPDTGTHLGTSAGNDQRTGLTYAIATGAGGYITVTSTDSDAMFGVGVVVSGVDDTTPIDVTGTHHAADNSATPTVNGVTTVTDGCLLITFISSDAGAGSVAYTAPTGWTMLYEGHEPGNHIAVAYKYQTSKGATGNIAWGNSNTSAENHVALMALRPGATALTHYSMTANAGGVVVSTEISKLAYSTSEDIRDENQLGINDVDYWDTGDALITDQNSDYLELEVP